MSLTPQFTYSSRGYIVLVGSVNIRGAVIAALTNLISYVDSCERLDIII